MTLWLAYAATAAACWCYGLARGGRVAQQALGIFALAYGVAIYLDWPFAGDAQPGWRTLNILALAASTAAFLGFYALAIGSRRYWPVWWAGFQLVTVILHLAWSAGLLRSPDLYRGLAFAWALPMLLLMAVGTARDRRHARHVSRNKTG
jgi:hypothetical protein